MRLPLLLLLAVSFTITGLTSARAANAVIAVGESQDSPASTSTPTPDAELEALDRETKIAKAQQAKAEADKAKAEADKAALEARLAAEKARLGIGVTSPSATAPSGDITGDKDKFIEAQLLAEFSARKASELVYVNVCDSQNTALKTNHIKALVVSGSGEKAMIVTYSAILAQLQFLHEQYLKLITQANDARTPKESAALLIPAATEAVKSVADLINMFRTSTEFKDQTVTVDTRMIVTLLTNKLLIKRGVCEVEEIYYPSVYTMGISPDVSTGPLITAYRNLLNDVAKGDQAVAANNELIATLTKAAEDVDTEIEKLQKAIKDHETPAPKTETKSKGKKKPPEEPFDLEGAKTALGKALRKKTAINSTIKELKQTAASVESFETSLADLLKLLTAVDATTNTPALVTLLRAERLAELLKKANTYSLELQVTAKGTNKITKNAFFSAKLSHSGGVSIGVNLFNNKDQLVLGQLEQFYIDYTNSKEIRRLTGFEKLDPSFAGQKKNQDKQQANH
jgi:hypothetical protein